MSLGSPDALHEDRPYCKCIHILSPQSFSTKLRLLWDCIPQTLLKISPIHPSEEELEATYKEDLSSAPLIPRSPYTITNTERTVMF